MFERRADGSEGVPAGGVIAVAMFAADLDEPRLAERAQLQRDGPERDVGHRRMNVAGGDFAIPHQPEDLAAAR